MALNRTRHLYSATIRTPYRVYTKKLPLPETVKKAVGDCIRKGMLADFLAKNRAEAIAVSIFEYDEEGRKAGLIEGRMAGHKEGFKESADNLAQPLKSLVDAGKAEEVNRVLSDNVYKKQLYREYISGNE